MNVIDELKKVVNLQDFDKDSVQSVVQLEQQVNEAEQAEKLSEHPTIQKLIKSWANKQQTAQKRLLTESSTRLPDRERDSLLNYIELCEEFISTFNGQNKRSLEQVAENFLRQARSSSNQPQLPDDLS